MEEVSLQIRDKTFKAKRELLCEYSDYFRAMFSGNYVESEQQQICIDVLDPNIMSIILNYMQMGLITLSEYSLSTIGEIAIAANFLQISELIKQIEYTLDIQLSESNWLETMTIAQNASYSQLEQFAVAHGLYSFQFMKPEFIPSIHTLTWYLSHAYLDAHTEFEVFKFGLEWAIKNDISSSKLLIILTCLDMKRITKDDLRNIKECISNYFQQCTDSLPFEIVDCLLELTNLNLEISELMLSKHKIELCQKFSESVLTETNSILSNSQSRLLTYTAVVPMWSYRDFKLELLTHYVYTFTEDKGFEQYLEVAEKNLWGWNVTSWGLTRLVIVCGEHGRGTGMFMKDVKVYDTLRKEWTHHGVKLPSRRHSGVVVIGDFLYIIGGVGGFRVVLEKALEYDLKQRTFRRIANFPDAIQNPAVCSHNNKLYAAGQKNIYCYEGLDKDCWTTIVGTEMRMGCLRSYKNYIYCTQGYFRHLYRFRPGIDKKLDLITNFTNLPAAMCSLGNCLLVFTRTECGLLKVEEFKGEETLDVKPRVLSNQSHTMRVNDVAGSCSLVMTVPPMCTELSEIQRLYLAEYSES